MAASGPVRVACGKVDGKFNPFTAFHSSLMKIIPTSLVLATAAVALQASLADAAVTRNFFSPAVRGDRVAFCTETNALCGKPVADAWCRYNGFSAAVVYQRAPVASDVQAVRFADSGAVCDGDSCLSFRQIKCIGDN